MKKLLFNRKSECIQPLRTLIEEQHHRTLVLWVFDCAPPVLALFEQHCPHDTRPRAALQAADAWARGNIKMPEAKRAIHAAHNAASAAQNPVAEAAGRAAAHAAATVHVETHALGLVFYGLTAFVYASPPQLQKSIVDEKLAWFTKSLLHLQNAPLPQNRTWAPFLLRDDVPNKEKLLHLKEQHG